ncbi:MAG TPA: hypothetical protein VG846_13735, partial [Actinomycetota bacterium]|nr:hypothetical protein [Actinomycetota bacterium]
MQERGGQDTDRPEAHDHDRLPEAGGGVQADLDGRLDQGVQGGDPRVQVVDGHRVAGVGHEPVLMGVEGEDPLPLPERGGRPDDA